MSTCWSRVRRFERLESQRARKERGKTPQIWLPYWRPPVVVGTVAAAAAVSFELGKRVACLSKPLFIKLSTYFLPLQPQSAIAFSQN